MDHLTDLSIACEATAGALPAATTLLPASDGVSLLDAKNELFLSYLQGLALRNLGVLRSIKEGTKFDGERERNDRLTKKLVEQRLYLEKGVRPLEQRIKYQVDKAVKAADDEEHGASKRLDRARNNKKHATKENSDSEEDADPSSEDEIDELSYRPNLAAFAAAPTETPDSRQEKSKQEGIYRPPRISATSMPDVDQKEKRERRPNRSYTVDEYVSNELSNAPMAEPSIGSTILAGGRETKSAKDLAREAERREYEETHLVRLPTESKKERAKQKRDRTAFGGEELRGLGESLDRIADLTRRSKTSALDKSRKRRAVEDGPRDNGIGGAFDIKRKRLEKRSKR